MKNCLAELRTPRTRKGLLCTHPMRSNGPGQTCYGLGMQRGKEQVGEPGKSATSSGAGPDPFLVA